MMSNQYHVLCWMMMTSLRLEFLDLWELHASMRMYQWLGDHREGDPLDQLDPSSSSGGKHGYPVRYQTLAVALDNELLSRPAFVMTSTPALHQELFKVYESLSISTLYH